MLESSWNLMAHGDARERKWRGNRRMEWVASTLTLPRNVVYPALLPLMRTTRLPVVDWTDAPADLNGLVRFAERQNLVSARVPSHFKRSLQHSIENKHFPSARPEGVCGRKRVAPLFLKVGNLLGWVISFTGRSFYLPGIASLCSLYGRLGELQS